MEIVPISSVELPIVSALSRKIWQRMLQEKRMDDA